METPKAKEIDKKTDELLHKFYHGDKLSKYEVDIERMYIVAKHEKQKKYQMRNSYRYKVRWTYSDLNRYQEQINYRMNESEYFGNPKPRFEPFDLDNAL